MGRCRQGMRSVISDRTARGRRLGFIRKVWPFSTLVRSEQSTTRKEVRRLAEFDFRPERIGECGLRRGGVAGHRRSRAAPMPYSTSRSTIYSRAFNVDVSVRDNDAFNFK